MKLPKISPKQIFSSNKTTRSAPSSFSSGTSSSTDSTSPHLKTSDVETPRTWSLPPSHSSGISGSWPDLPADIHSELVQAFRLIDRDGDGKITTGELHALLSRLGAQSVSEDELSSMVTDVDRDGDGCVSLEEFGAISSAFAPACGSELRDVFEFFDADKDGKISAEELLGVFEAIGDERCTLADCRRMICGVDSDGDGFVCFEDFTRMMERQR